MEGFTVQIKESSRELSARERVMVKDTTNATKLDEAANDRIIITPVDYVILAIHNEKSDNKDYLNYVIIDEQGNKYVTGSNSFWTSFLEIYTEMQGESEPWSIECYKVDSKNYKGKQFLTCSMI